ncbi:MAG: NfeD family protein [Jatrophihabitans sp.]
MPDWLIWLIAAGALAAAETVTVTFVLLMFAGGAGAAAITAAFGAPVLLQIVVAIFATVALLVGVRPIAQRHLITSGPAVMGSDALVGMEALALSQVDAQNGRVRLNGGEWSARAYDDTEVIEVGTPVRVVRINGATALVVPDVPHPALESGEA